MRTEEGWRVQQPKQIFFMSSRSAPSKTLNFFSCNHRFKYSGVWVGSYNLSRVCKIFETLILSSHEIRCFLAHTLLIDILCRVIFRISLRMLLDQVHIKFPITVAMNKHQEKVAYRRAIVINRFSKITLFV